MANAVGLGLKTAQGSDVWKRAARDAGRARYAAAQGARVAWFAAHYVLANRLAHGRWQSANEPKFQPQSPAGDKKRIRDAFLMLFAKDRANIEKGLYPAPKDYGFAQAIDAVLASGRFLSDLPKVSARRAARGGVEVRAETTRGELPAYYLQNFHFQTGGWLTEESAKIYDTQVEVLFTGAADAMRRLALGSLARALKGRDQRQVRVLDLACGNGRFLTQVMAAFPRLAASGLDLSPAYADMARARLARWPQVDVMVGQAEAIPVPDQSLDAVTSVYLFHELPPRVRREVAAEIARVLKPGGVFVFADSIQAQDNPDLDQMLEWFPVLFHEPFYASYQSEDLYELFAEAGLRSEETEIGFLTKIVRFRRV